MDITRVVYGYTTLPERMVLPGGGNDPIPIDLAFFLIRLPEHTVLVDAGCDTMKGFVLRDFIGPVETLRQLGVATNEITDIIVTHAHGDHMAGIIHFPHARIIVQRQALEKGRKRRFPIGICTLQSGPFSTILRKKSTVGVSLTVDFFLVLWKNYALWSASQF